MAKIDGRLQIYSQGVATLPMSDNSKKKKDKAIELTDGLIFDVPLGSGTLTAIVSATESSTSSSFVATG